jgi:hypothetical protein
MAPLPHLHGHVANFVRTHRRVRFVSFFKRPGGGAYDLGTKPRSLAACRRHVAPLRWAATWWHLVGFDPDAVDIDSLLHSD